MIKKKGRPRKEVNERDHTPKQRGRPRLENPCLPGKPKAGNLYFREYYANKLKNCLIQCPNCNAMTEKTNITTHMKSKHCAKVASFINTQIMEI